MHGEYILTSNGGFVRYDELYHWGVKGMKWGVRRYQNKDGSLILKKGSTVKRVSLSPEDPTYDNKKYVSINDKDHEKWEDVLGKGYRDIGHPTYVQTYKTNKDLKVMSTTEQGKLYAKMLLDTEFANQAIIDTDNSTSALHAKKSNDNAENISRNIAMQTKTGHDFVKRVLESGYDALVDTHGTNVAKNPLIVLNPDSNLSIQAYTDFTKATKEWLDGKWVRNS